jgi:hypothetical protein
MPQGIALFVGRVQPAGHFNAGKAMRVSPALRVFAKTAIPAVPNEQIAGTRHAGALAPARAVKAPCQAACADTPGATGRFEFHRGNTFDYPRIWLRLL